MLRQPQRLRYTLACLSATSNGNAHIHCGGEELYSLTSMSLESESMSADEGDESTESLLNILPDSVKLAVKACLAKRQEAVQQGTVPSANARSHL